VEVVELGEQPGGPADQRLDVRQEPLDGHVRGPAMQAMAGVGASLPVNDRVVLVEQIGEHGFRERVVGLGRAVDGGAAGRIPKLPTRDAGSTSRHCCRRPAA
jgi:hypothetical protein